MSIVSVNLNHCCGSSDDNKRKRNYQTKDICAVSNVLQVYEPAMAGNARQFAKMTKSATGVSIKTGQAHLAVKSSASNSIEAHMGQYFWLKSLLRAYTDSDTDGSFVLEFTKCLWNRALDQFYPCYICLSIAKPF
jgi:hypothetical protein